jgi:hypothetical protein
MPCAFPEQTPAHGIEQKLVVAAELLVGAVSLVATFNHFKGAGWRFSTVAAFHLTHALFSTTYGVLHVLLLNISSICFCDPTNFLYVLYLVSFAAMWEIFVRHWKRALQKLTKFEKRSRVILYSGLSLWFVISHAVYLIPRPCSPGNTGLTFIPEVVLLLVFIADLSELSFRVYRRATGLQGQQGSKSNNRAFIHALCFASVPFSMFLGTILICLEIFPYITGENDPIPKILDSHLLLFVFPSVMVLVLTWQRDYIQLGDKALPQHEIELEWNSANSVYGSESFQRRMSSRASSAPVSLLSIEEMDTLKNHAPLTSQIKRESKGGVLRFCEDLQPPASFRTTTQFFLAEVRTKHYERAFGLHLESAEQLVATSKPTAPETDLGFLEKQRQHAELEEGCEALSRKYDAFARSLAEPDG